MASADVGDDFTDGLFTTAVDEETLEAARVRVADIGTDAKPEIGRIMTDKLRRL